MNESEFLEIILAMLTLGLVIGFDDLIKNDFISLGNGLLAAVIVVGVSVLGKKIMAKRLDADVEHQIWRMDRYGIRPHDHIKKSLPIGVIGPLFISAITLGALNLMSVLTYETKAMKRRAARRFGPFSFTEITDFHNALIGAAGIVGLLIISFASYFTPWAIGILVGKIAAFYAFWNMVPASKLDGSQIFFGSRVLWATLAVITLIFTSYAILLI
jgi:Zn-dependent protease